MRSEIVQKVGEALSKMFGARVDPNNPFAAIRRLSLPDLIVALGSEDSYVRGEALDRLCYVKDHAADEAAFQLLEDPIPEVRRRALGYVRLMAPQRAVELVGTLPIEELHVMRIVVIRTLNSERSARAVLALTAYLGDPRIGHLALAAIQRQLEILPITSFPDLASGVRQLATDPGAPVRACAASILGQLSKSDAPELRALLTDTDRYVRRAAAHSLGRRLDRSAAPALISRLTDWDPKTRQLVVNALRRIGDPSAGENLIPMLDDPSPRVRRSAVRAVAVICGKSGVAALRKASNDFDVPTSRNAQRALERLERASC